jgi:hypothetical protein
MPINLKGTPHSTVLREFGVATFGAGRSPCLNAFGKRPNNFRVSMNVYRHTLCSLLPYDFKTVGAVVKISRNNTKTQNGPQKNGKFVDRNENVIVAL